MVIVRNNVTNLSTHLSVDEYLINGYQIAIDGYSRNINKQVINNTINEYVHVECQIINMLRHRTYIHEVDIL